MSVQSASVLVFSDVFNCSYFFFQAATRLWRVVTSCASTCGVTHRRRWSPARRAGDSSPTSPASPTTSIDNRSQVSVKHRPLTPLRIHVQCQWTICQTLVSWELVFDVNLNTCILWQILLKMFNFNLKIQNKLRSIIDKESFLGVKFDKFVCRVRLPVFTL